MRNSLPIFKVKSSLNSFLGSKSENTFVFQLQGRLGNQIWGLSDAYLLHRMLGKKVLVDLNSCNMDDENSDFYEYLFNLPWLEAARLEFEASPEISGIKVLSIDDFDSPNNSIGYRGFSASYSSLKKSGLFAESELPDFISGRPDTPTQTFISLSIRRSDYWQNPHLGVLPVSYYLKALDLIDDHERGLPIWLFGDEHFQGLKNMFPRNIQSRIVCVSRINSPLKDLARLSLASFSIISNSTFSFLGAYFSQSNEMFIPKPFYLAVEGWNEKLSNPRSREILYSSMPKVRYLKLRFQKRIRGL